MNPTLAVVIFVVGLFVVAIGLHEFGHYWTATRFGMRADRFFLGFGPTLWSTRRGETEFGVKALPLGGFVRIKGMSPTDERLRPVSTTVFEPGAVADDRRAHAQELDQPVSEVAAVPPQTWRRLDGELEDRGVARDVRISLVQRTQAAVGPHPTPAEARLAFEDAAADLLPATGRVGDVRHRVLEGDRDRFFHDRPAWQRAIVLIAGSTMHFVVAVVLLFVAFWFWGDVVVEPRIDRIIPEVALDASCQPEQDPSCMVATPAVTAGLQPGDRIVEVAGTRLGDFDQVQQALSSRPGQATELVIERGGSLIDVTVTPLAIQECQDGTCTERGLVGFAPVARSAPMPIGDALHAATLGDGGFIPVFGQTLGQIGKVFGPEGFANVFGAVSGDTERGLESPSSPIGIGRTTYQLAEEYGPYMVLAVLALVNIFVGIFNLMPLPPLDGGHLAVVGIEKGVNTVRRARGQATDFTVDPRALTAVAIPVVVLLGTMFLSVLWLDIVNPVDLR
ncbi:MAG TPA: site-2 protease family protein [Nitriliruptorales bacterium]